MTTFTHLETDMQVQLAIFRFLERKTDILISMNTPVYINTESAAAPHAGAGHKSTHTSALALLATMLKTFHIHNYSLFAV